MRVTSAPPTVAGIALAAALCAVVALAIGEHAAASTAYVWNLPAGFRQPTVPPDNPMSQAKVDLGKRLFFDTRLSITGRYACASCHRPELAFTDARIRAVGATGETLAHQSMSLVNVAYAVTFGWTDAGFDSLESQMRQPLFNRHPVEIGLSGREAALLRELTADADTHAAFVRAFPASANPVTLRHLIQSIASYERTLVFARSAFDRYIFDDDGAALTASAKRGMALFFEPRLGCAQCHFGLNLAGPAAVVGKPRPVPLFADTGTQGRFKVPGLRNVALTAPYMHDGRFATLEEVIDHYEHLERDRAPGETVDPQLRSFRLKADEKHDLIDFLGALSDLQFAAPAPTQ
jgi:cytochrome c peroxidase